MALAAGDKLGPYELVAPLGEGGMGEVWKARDTRLNRIVAVKTSKAGFGERFQREAHAIAALNHPNICQIYDVGENYIVMEHIEGAPPHGPLPVDVALRYGAQILDALGAAHRAGIVHRDLKPANILVTKSGVKLLDFGLAAALETTSGEDEFTRTMRLTGEHAIVGTLQYMAPEQLEAKRADARTDLFAFGLVMYEMLTGKPAFVADSRASLIAGILKENPPSASSQVTSKSEIPPALDQVIASCLAKDPDERCQTARDLRRELDRIAVGGAPMIEGLPAPGPRSRIWMSVTAALALALLALAIAYLRKKPAAETVVRASVLAPEEGASFVLTPNDGGIALSADGRSLVYVADSGKGPRLYVRALDSFEARQIPGGEGAGKPFWSPSGKAIAFFKLGELDRADLTGGEPVKLCDFRGNRGGAWNQDGVILASSSTSDGDGRIYRVSADGGKPQPVTTLDAAAGENSNYWPEFLPDGRHFLYLARYSDRTKNTIYVGSLDDAPAQQRRVRVVPSSYAARFMPVSGQSSGYLFYVNGTSLFAQGFNPSSMKLEGDRVLVAENVSLIQTNGYADYALAPDGTIAYGAGTSWLTKLSWRDRTGKEQETAAAHTMYSYFDLSPDGRSVLASTFEALNGGMRVTQIDLEQGTEKAVAGKQTGLTNAAWSPNGREIAYASPQGIMIMAADGSGSPKRLTDGGAIVTGWSHDGRWLTFYTGDQVKMKSWVIELTGERKKQLLVDSTASVSMARLSPDSRWFAYTCDESGSDEVYVQSFPIGRGKWQISSSGGAWPMWRPDGKELFYVAETKGGSGGAATLMAVNVTKTGDSIHFGTPAPLFTWPQARIYFAIADMGRRFLVTEPLKNGNRPINLILHWQPPAQK